MAVPWTQLIRWAPEIITISRELLQKTRKTPSTTTDLVHMDDRADLRARIAALEENERRQAELVERMAEQQAELARAVLSLHARERVLIGAIGILAVLLAALGLWVALR